MSITGGLSNLKDKTFTIINRVPTSETNHQTVKWKKFTLEGCGWVGGIYDKSSGTVINRNNTWTAWIGNWQAYTPPTFCDGGFYALSDEEISRHYTVTAGDLLIFDDIPDSEPANEREFQTLASKYKNMGGLLTGAEVYINYRPNGNPWRTNHITIVRS